MLLLLLVDSVYYDKYEKGVVYEIMRMWLWNADCYGY